MSNQYQKSQSILVIGASGRLGTECLYHLSSHPSRPDVHAFCRNPEKLDKFARLVCTSVIEGCARHAVDIADALLSTNADWIVVCIGTGKDLCRSNIRTSSAENISRVLMRPAFLHVRVIAVSMSMPCNLKCLRLRNVLSDHKGQESALEVLGHRSFVIRPKPFQDDLPCKIKCTETKNVSFALSYSDSSCSNESSISAKSPTSVFGKSLYTFGFLSDNMIQVGGLRRNHSPTTNRSEVSFYITHHICESTTYLDIITNSENDKIKSHQ